MEPVVASDELIKRFRFSRLLLEDSRAKLVTLLGHIERQDNPDVREDSDRAILLIEKLPFDAKELPVLTTERLEKVFDSEKNDIYMWAKSFTKSSSQGFPDVKLTLIYPATDIHIAKYSPQERSFFEETPHLYQNVTLPFINAIPEKRIQWVYNILEGTAEAEKVLLRDNDPEKGFVLVPDMKWDGKLVNTLYLVGIVQRRDLRSIRDLSSAHLPFLLYLRDKITSFVNSQYNLSKSKQRIFFHYQPSYYHLHVHVTNIEYGDAPGIYVGQAHLLDTVIDNIQNIAGDYYQKCTLLHPLGHNHGLYGAWSKWSEEHVAKKSKTEYDQ